jgi:hypothetical protein
MKTVTLNSRDRYDIGGRTYSLYELQDAVIKASAFDELIEDIQGGK